MAHQNPLPTLPAGHTVLFAYGFRDDKGNSFAFYRVYGPGRLLVKERSFWFAGSSVVKGTPEEAPRGTVVTYDDANDLFGGISYENFASVIEMRGRLPGVLA